MTLIGKEAPDFTAKAVVGDRFVDYTLSNNWKNGKYTVLFFYPLDFTFVCPTELVAFSDRVKEFNERNCEVASISIDSHFTHLAWKNVPRSQGGVGDIQYPMVADVKKEIAQLYDVLSPEGTTFRGLFLIDAHGKVRHALVNDMPIGRSVDEALRILDAVQYNEAHGEVCPADWTKGQPTIKPNPVESKEYFGKTAGDGVTVTR